MGGEGRRGEGRRGEERGGEGRRGEERGGEGRRGEERGGEGRRKKCFTSFITQAGKICVRPYGPSPWP